MDRPRDVALFIDFENIRYSVLNTYHRELSGSMLIDVARCYGHVTLARAYADFDEHPERVRRDMQVSGISAVNVLSMAVGERSKGCVDLEMFADVFETLLDRPHLSTFLFMTGDRRFIRIVTLIRNRFGKDVVVAGVRGSVSNDLIEAAGGRFEPLEFEPVADSERRHALIRFVDRLERSKPFITFKYVSAAMTTSTEFPGMSEEEARDFVAEAIQEGLLRKHQRSDGYRVLHLNRDHQQVFDLLDEGPESDDYHEEEFDEGLAGDADLLDEYDDEPDLDVPGSGDDQEPDPSEAARESPRLWKQ